ncbi:MAG: DUF58 domain-containing protein [Planctomycetaceae bacterium]
MNVRRHFPTFGRLYRRWNARYTPGGKAISLLALYSIPSILSFSDAMPFVGLCAFGVLGLTAILGRVFRPKVKALLRSPDFATVGQPFVASVSVENQSKQPALDLVVGFPPNLDDWVVQQDFTSFSLEPEANEVQRFNVTAKQRGVQSLPPANVMTTFPVNLIRRLVRTAEATEISILPRPRPLAFGAEEGISQLLGIEQRLLATAGTGFEYIGSREYREGPVRRWDYSSWARLGEPVVREFAEEADRQVAILVDTRIASGWRNRVKAHFEDYICGGYSIVEQLLSADIEVACCVVGESTTTDTARVGSHGHHRLRKLFAKAQRTRMKDGESPKDAILGHTDGPILVFFPEWDVARAELVSELCAANPCVRPVVYSTDENPQLPENVLSMQITEKGIRLL